jgi:HlyD family secretion protein
MAVDGVVTGVSGSFAPKPPSTAAEEVAAQDVPDEKLVAALRADRGRRRRRRLLAVFVFAAFAVALVLGLARGRRKDVATYDTQEAVTGAVVMSVTATGAVEPRNAVDIGADISGRVDHVFVDVNDLVQKGALLALLQTEVLDLAVTQAQAAVAGAKAARGQAEVAVSDAQTALHRAVLLYETATISSAELQSAQSTLARAKAGLDVVDANIQTSRAALAMARANRRKAEIRAPVSGIVLTRNVEPGQVVISALQAAVLFRLAEDLSHLEVRVDIDEADVGRVREHQPATFTVSAFPDTTFTGHLRSLTHAPRMLQQVVTYEGIIDVDTRGGLLRPGMTATVRIETGRIETGRGPSDLDVEAASGRVPESATRNTLQGHTSDIANAAIVPTSALRFTPSSERHPMRAGPPQTTTEVVTRPSPRVWVLRGGTPVAREVLVLGSDGERAAVSGVDVGEAVVIAERSAP